MKYVGLIAFLVFFGCAGGPQRETLIRAQGYPWAYQQMLLEKRVQLGMSQHDVRLSWGEPQRINRSVGRWGVHDQWVYGQQYLYFENGKLRSWQE
jgi:hypothetical protein